MALMQELLESRQMEEKKPIEVEELEAEISQSNMRLSLLVVPAAK